MTNKVDKMFEEFCDRREALTIGEKRAYILEWKQITGPEDWKYIDDLPENQKCETCSELLWNCECMLKIDLHIKS